MATGAVMELIPAILSAVGVGAAIAVSTAIPERYRPKWLPHFNLSILIPEVAPTFIKQFSVLQEQVLTLQSRLVELSKAEHGIVDEEQDMGTIIDTAIRTKISGDVDGLSLDQLFAMRRDVEQEREMSKARSDLIFAADQEMESATKIKRYMLNLFILFNVGLMLNFALYNVVLQKELPAITQQVILGLYVSMAVFIVYVYRACNARVLILLAVQEDTKRYFDALRYLSSRPSTVPTTNRDIAVLKLLLINRSERERATQHPYELVIKGVQNSAILLKGGKVETKEQATKTKPQEKSPG
jgi:hypothetical protein